MYCFDQEFQLGSAMAEKYSISRRQSRRIVADAYDVVKQDLVEMDINRPEYLLSKDDIYA